MTTQETPKRLSSKALQAGSLFAAGVLFFLLSLFVSWPWMVAALVVVIALQIGWFLYPFGSASSHPTERKRSGASTNTQFQQPPPAILSKLNERDG